MKLNLEKQIFMYFLCIATALATGGEGGNTAVTKTVSVEFEKKEKKTSSAIMMIKNPIDGKDKKKIIIFYKMKYRDFKLSEEEVSFSGQFEFENTTYSKAKESGFFKPKSEIPHQFEIIGVELTDKKHEEFEKEKSKLTKESLEKFMKECKDSVKMFSMKGAHSDVKEGKNTQLALQTRKKEIAENGETNTSYEYKLNYVTTKYSESGFPDSYGLKELKITQKITNNATNSLEIQSVTEKKLGFVKADFNVTGENLAFNVTKSDDHQSSEIKFVEFGKADEAENFWKILTAGVSEVSEGWGWGKKILVGVLSGVAVVGLLIGIYFLISNSKVN